MLEKLNGKVHLAINSNKNDDMVKTITENICRNLNLQVCGVSKKDNLLSQTLGLLAT